VPDKRIRIEGGVATPATIYLPEIIEEAGFTYA
jgi:hypothetical protein